MKLIIFGIEDSITDKEIQKIIDSFSSKLNKLTPITVLTGESLTLLDKKKETPFEEIINDILIATNISNHDSTEFEIKFWQLYNNGKIKDEIIDYILKEYDKHTTFINRTNTHSIIKICKIIKSFHKYNG